MTNKERTSQKLKIAIIVLMIVFIVSMVALTARIVYVCFFDDRTVTVVVPNNMLAADRKPHTLPTAPLLSREFPLAASKEAEATVVELFQGQPSDNAPFHTENMFPGDSVTKYYCLKVYHKEDISVYFSVSDIQQTKELSKTLQIKVTKLDTHSPQLLCSTSFADAASNSYEIRLSANSKQETLLYYRIDVTLPTSAGNECQGASLRAAFQWYAERPSDETACENRCNICGKCLDPNCTKPECSEKCTEHSADTTDTAHSCESACKICGKCLDAACTEYGCLEKCKGHDDLPLTPKPSVNIKSFLPYLLLPMLALLSLLALLIVNSKKSRGGH